eukprot:NODE_6184_length_596_cov_14.228519_g5775_i0.p1 GENE.NODE_6184_length_596_cov_14.228519_g5775_i0~~NODE_6184_length_596_cov_14.228519_g5775_i0.p1  ORF type:complete len:123 (+),score=30.53 NODE_6184_length_596_cov_14.228519_g5775_i0:38-370(+)
MEQANREMQAVMDQAMLELQEERMLSMREADMIDRIRANEIERMRKKQEKSLQKAPSPLDAPSYWRTPMWQTSSHTFRKFSPSYLNLRTRPQSKLAKRLLGQTRAPPPAM